MEHKGASDLDKIPFYYSRPDLRPPRLNIITRDPKRATDGYIFTAPSFTGDYRPDSGPYIFDTNGSLIWSGLTTLGASATANTHDLHPCAYQNRPHLCLWQGTQRGTHGTGRGVILDDTYQIVRTVQSSSSRQHHAGVDFHEFTLTRPDGDTALIVTYPPRFVDGLWVLDSCFEEVPVDDAVDDGKDALFSWCATDHVPLEENTRRAAFEAEALGSNGMIPDRAWDYVHINSVDKATDGSGDYLISARQLDTIFRISGADGSIVWRLGGSGAPSSSFERVAGLDFARQHDARFVETQSSNGSATISIFNNANDGVELKKNPSRGLVVHLDTEAMTAQLVSTYGLIPPETNELRRDFIESRGMGNVQRLESGNILTSFGRFGALAEYASSGGTPVLYADMTAPTALPLASRWSATNYRAYLYPTADWSAQPRELPALWTYARTPANLMTFYVSWNGATKVKKYRFWISDEDSPAPPPAHTFNFAGTWPRTGFETNFTIGSTRPWSFAEALDADGRSLANSSIVRTYVPRHEDQKACGKWHCFPELTAGAQLTPIDESAVLGEGPDVGGFDGPGTLSLLEHIFALIGLGLCAWLAWVRIRDHKPARDTRGYKPIGDKENEREAAMRYDGSQERS